MKKPRKRSSFKEDIAKYLLDLGKLMFGSIVFGSIMRIQVPQDLLLTIGTAAATVVSIVGLILGIREMKTGRPEKPRRKRRNK